MRFLFLLYVSMSLLFYSDMEIDERIRQKVENLPVFKALNKEYEVYCIPSIREVYLKNEFNPFWNKEEKVDELVEVIENSRNKGLYPEDYHLSDILEIRKVNSIEYKMQYLVLNPTWTVPPTILTKDIQPEIRKDLKYLEMKNICVYDKSGKRLNADSIDWRSKNIFL